MRTLLMHPYVLVFVGGGAGSVLRYIAGRLIPATLTGSPFPTAILLVNVLASFVLGVVVGWVLNRSVGEEARLLIGVGFCGGLVRFPVLVTIPWRCCNMAALVPHCSTLA